ncbi:unnamed protein product [Vicia faba]|uniref:Uncharacterized protein n=1 Tax=Vicia faba TaxID=3906 RepID=A0AAV0YWR9_VICFA|nr:unnamed protein product [Vicia faba]
MPPRRDTGKAVAESSRPKKRAHRMANAHALPAPDFISIEKQANWLYASPMQDDGENFVWAGSEGEADDQPGEDPIPEETSMPNPGDSSTAEGGPPPIGAKLAKFNDTVIRDIIYQFALQEVGHLRAIKNTVVGFSRPLLDLSQSSFAKLPRS